MLVSLSPIWLISDLLMAVGVYHILRWLYDQRQKPSRTSIASDKPWRVYVRPFNEHYVGGQTYGNYSKKSAAGVEVGLSNGELTLKIGEALLADRQFEQEVAKLQEMAESRLHIIELESTQ